jgi:hypothetical protein
MTKGRAFTLFFALLVVFVILLAVTLSMHSGTTPACTGGPLNCPSGGGAAQDANGVARGISAIGTFLAGIAAVGALIYAIVKDRRSKAERG